MENSIWQKYQVFLWDFDGTLCDTEPDLRNTWLNFFKNKGIECPHFNEVFRVGPPTWDMVSRFFPDSPDDFKHDLARGFSAAYDSCGFPLTVPYPGVEKHLQLLKSQGKRLFIVSNKRFNPLSDLLKKLNFEQYWDGVYAFPERIVPGLNKAENIKRLLAQEGVLPDEVIMVGDTQGDVSAGKTCGIATCAVNWGYAPLEELQNAAPDYIVGFKDLLC